MESKSSSMNHGLIFGMLVILVLGSVGVSLLRLPGLTNNLVVFGIAIVMAGLVVFQYMNLKLEGPLVVWLAIIPLIMFAILVLVLLSDSSQPIFSLLERGLKREWK